MAELQCEVDIMVSRNQVYRRSQYGVIEPKRSGSRGSRGVHLTGGFGTLLVGTSRTSELTFHIGGHESCDLDRARTKPTQPIPPGKHIYLQAEKVKEIEHWLAKVDLEGDEGSLGAY
jgi:hypothetical protein